MELLIFAGLMWVAPIVVFCYLSDRDGKNTGVVFVAAFLFSWVGGIVAYAVLKGEKPQDKWKREDEDLEKQREEAALRALGKLPARKGEAMSEARKRELEGLLGGKR